MFDAIVEFPFSELVHCDRLDLAPGEWYLSCHGVLGLACTIAEAPQDHADPRPVLEFDTRDRLAVRMVGRASTPFLKIGAGRVRLRAASLRDMARRDDLVSALVGTSSDGATLTAAGPDNRRDDNLAFVNMQSGVIRPRRLFGEPWASLWTDRWEVVLVDEHSATEHLLYRPQFSQEPG